MPARGLLCNDSFSLCFGFFSSYLPKCFDSLFTNQSILRLLVLLRFVWSWYELRLNRFRKAPGGADVRIESQLLYYNPNPIAKKRITQAVSCFASWASPPVSSCASWHPTLFGDSMITLTHGIKVKTRNRYESKL